VLGETDWRGQEQAAVLLGHLDYKPATKRLIELLRVERGEAMVAAAWALRQLAVPDTLPAVLEFVRGEHRKMLSAAKMGRLPPSTARDRQLSQLVQFMGKSRYQLADQPLREMLPRLIPGLPYNPPQTPLESETRTAAVWALGLFHEGKPDSALVVALQSRMKDLPSPAGEESSQVRRMAAVSLGRMKATEAMPTLRRFYDGKLTQDFVNNASGWAISQITGEPLPPAGTTEQIDRRWFLSGID
jgi:HEAT repeat protein